ncbi:MAG: winged helix-turn-helix transcriptional regulator [archaeon]
MIPVIRGIEFKNKREFEAYLLADNQTAIAGGWNEEGLAITFRHLSHLIHPSMIYSRELTTEGEVTQDPDPVEAVYDWASRFTAESRGQLLSVLEYHWSSEISELASRLLHSKRQLIAVLGCQGVGKTSAMYALDGVLDKDFYYSLFTRAKNKRGGESPNRQVISLNYTDLKNHGEIAKSTLLQFCGLLNPYADEIITMLRLRRIRSNVGRVSLIEAEILLGEEKCRSAMFMALLKAAPRFKNILIDLPDYSKTDRRSISRDLDRIQTLWRGMMSLPNVQTNLVLFIQKENFRDHFFFGKMDMVTIPPFKSQELMAAYEKKFKSFRPFKEDALLRLSQLSQGVFRRYLQYIRLTIDKWRIAQKPLELIDTTIVESAITKEQLLRDLDSQLTELFPKNPEARSTAIEIIRLLQENSGMNQKSVAEQLNMPEYRLSRIFDRLEKGGHIKREKTGLKKTVRVTTPL